jgi:predicted nucleic acid-binding protein
MIILDTNVLIEILKNNNKTIDKVENFNEEVAISSISSMELYYGAINKAEIIKLEKFISLFQTLHLTHEISIKSMLLIKLFAKSHNLTIPDSLIAATAIVFRYKLFTYNLKDFKFIDKLELI